MLVSAVVKVIGRQRAYLASAEIYSPDTTPPQVSCGAADGAWHTSDVTIAYTQVIPNRGWRTPRSASFQLDNECAGRNRDGRCRDENSREVCNTIGACTTAGPITGNKVDKKPPTITITSPAADATYQVNAVVGADYDCADGGSGVASCQGPVANGRPIDTSSAGTKTFTVTATDTAGNSSTLTVTYSVGRPCRSATSRSSKATRDQRMRSSPSRSPQRAARP